MDVKPLRRVLLESDQERLRLIPTTTKKKQNALLLNLYQLWVANRMAELIDAAPTVASDPPPKRIADFLPACIERISNGNVSEFARLVNVNKMTVHSWSYS